MDSNMHVTLTETANNTKYDVVLPWRNFTLWQKVRFGRTEYELKAKEEKDCVRMWYESDEEEPFIKIMCGVLSDYPRDFQVVKPMIEHTNDVFRRIDKRFETKLLCMEKLYDRLVSEYRDIFCVIE